MGLGHLGYQPSAVVVVDADLKSIRPHWIQALADPILNGYAFVSPSYSRNPIEYDGTITNHICYPPIYGILGRNLRLPIGGDVLTDTTAKPFARITTTQARTGAEPSAEPGHTPTGA